METLLILRPTALTVAIRREIVSLLATADTVTVSVATAQVAAGWSARRRRRGDSPPSVRTAEAIVFQVGADLADEVAAQSSEDSPAATSSGRAPKRGKPTNGGSDDPGERAGRPAALRELLERRRRHAIRGMLHE